MEFYDLDWFYVRLRSGNSISMPAFLKRCLYSSPTCSRKFFRAIWRRPMVTVNLTARSVQPGLAGERISGTACRWPIVICRSRRFSGNTKPSGQTGKAGSMNCEGFTPMHPDWVSADPCHFPGFLPSIHQHVQRGGVPAGIVAGEALFKGGLRAGLMISNPAFSGRCAGYGQRCENACDHRALSAGKPSSGGYHLVGWNADQGGRGLTVCYGRSNEAVPGFDRKPDYRSLWSGWRLYGARKPVLSPIPWLKPGTSAAPIFHLQARLWCRPIYRQFAFLANYLGKRAVP